MAQPVDPNDVLSFWFDPPGISKAPALTLSTRWFAQNGTDMQKQMDELVKDQFLTTLQFIETNDTQIEYWNDKPEWIVAKIIVLDQFSRHIYRNELNRIDKIKRNDTIARELSEALVKDMKHTNLPVPYFVFGLMPWRHNAPSVETLQQLLEEIDLKEQSIDNDKELLMKFRRTTQKRLEATGEGRDTTKEQSSATFLDADILERPHRIVSDENMPSNPLYKAMHAYLTKKKARNYPYMAISLSGGVDSMVVAQLLCKLAPFHNNFKVVAVHLDYGNRPESRAESDYVEKWCAHTGITWHVRRIHEVKRASTKREEYEQISRDIRYGTYKKIMTEFNAPGMCVGHHMGDVQENVISNMMKGISLLNLNGMAESSIVNGVMIWRPLLAFEKQIIFDFAHEFGVPYFKDTTPLWSTRGKLRTKLIPLLQELYGQGVLRNLSLLGSESEECDTVMQSTIFHPIHKSIHHTKMAATIDCTLLEPQPFFIWKEVLRHLCHSVLGTSMMREKPIKELMKKLARHNPATKEGFWITLKKDMRSYVTYNHTLILFDENLFGRFAIPNTIDKVLKDRCVQLGQEYTIGPWKIQTSGQIDPYPDTELHPTTTNKVWVDDIINRNGFEYYIPIIPGDPFLLEVNSEHRWPFLRTLEIALTNYMPIVKIRPGPIDLHNSNAYQLKHTFSSIFVQIQYEGIQIENAHAYH